MSADQVFELRISTRTGLCFSNNSLLRSVVLIGRSSQLRVGLVAIKRRGRMLLAVLVTNSEGNILVERFNGVPAEERLHWRSFLVKLGADNLKGASDGFAEEEYLAAAG
uniref:Uncharacterized protein n=1 Tax=Kalanchoe fedtschenkoi TaxID=63787 RepID=A0A7N0UF21_KALFE